MAVEIFPNTAAGIASAAAIPNPKHITESPSTLVVMTGDDLPDESGDYSDYTPRQVPTVAPASTTCYLFAHPATQAGHRNLGERQIFVPLEDDDNGVTWYYGMFFGTKANANMVPSISDICLAQPGLHVLASALTMVGSWVTAPASIAAGAFFSSGGRYSLTAGDTISGSVTGSLLAIRWYGTTNGGFGVVAIDGDYTRATKLPAFTVDDFAAGRCRSEDVGRRYLGTYNTVSSNDCTIIADDLSYGAHTITVQATGTKPAASSASRCYVEAFASNNGGTIGQSNVHMIPRWIYHMNSVSAQCYVPQWAPAGSSDYQFMGENHSDNSAQSKETTTSAFTVHVGNTDQTALATGTYASASQITIRHTTTLAHKADLATAVATKDRTYTFQAGRQHPVMCDVGITWGAAGTLEIEYAAMQTITTSRVAPAAGAHTNGFTEAEISGQTVPFLGINDGTVYYFRGPDRQIFSRGQNIEAWASLISESAGSAMHSTHAGAYQDRSTPGEEKMYLITSMGTQHVPSGTSRRFLIGYGARSISR